MTSHGYVEKERNHVLVHGDYDVYDDLHSNIDEVAMAARLRRVTGFVLQHIFLKRTLVMPTLKEPSPIFSTFFPTFGDFGITRKLIII